VSRRKYSKSPARKGIPVRFRAPAPRLIKGLWRFITVNSFSFISPNLGKLNFFAGKMHTTKSLSKYRREWCFDQNDSGCFGADFLFINQSAGRGYKPAYIRDLWAVYEVKELTLCEATRRSTICDWA